MTSGQRMVSGKLIRPKGHGRAWHAALCGVSIDTVGEKPVVPRKVARLRPVAVIKG